MNAKSVGIVAGLTVGSLVLTKQFAPRLNDVIFNRDSRTTFTRFKSFLGSLFS